MRAACSLGVRPCSLESEPSETVQRRKLLRFYEARRHQLVRMYVLAKWASKHSGDLGKIQVRLPLVQCAVCTMRAPLARSVCDVRNRANQNAGLTTTCFDCAGDGVDPHGPRRRVQQHDAGAQDRVAPRRRAAVSATSLRACSVVLTSLAVPRFACARSAAARSCCIVAADLCYCVRESIAVELRHVLALAS